MHINEIPTSIYDIQKMGYSPHKKWPQKWQIGLNWIRFCPAELVAWE